MGGLINKLARQRKICFRRCPLDRRKMRCCVFNTDTDESLAMESIRERPTFSTTLHTEDRAHEGLTTPRASFSAGIAFKR